MQYLLMCCIDEKQWESIPQAQRDGIMQQYGEWVQDTTQSGHYQGGAKLRGTSSATTVREKNGRPVITDGPFAETKEQLGGYHVLEVARRIPTLKVGGAIEVRPIDYPSGRVTSAAADASQAPIIA